VSDLPAGRRNDAGKRANAGYKKYENLKLSTFDNENG
jgi:hypothetical protein